MSQAANVRIKKTARISYSFLSGFSEPEMQSCHCFRAIGLLIISAGKLRRVAVLFPVVYADVGRELPGDCIPQPQARFQNGQPGTGAGD